MSTPSLERGRKNSPKLLVINRQFLRASIDPGLKATWTEYCQVSGGTMRKMRVDTMHLALVHLRNKQPPEIEGFPKLIVEI
jgi:hypothetical protein